MRAASQATTQPTVPAPTTATRSPTRGAASHSTLTAVSTFAANTARALGVPFRSPAAARRDADIVVHTSGKGAGLATALELAAVEATVVEASWYGDDSPAVPLGGAFHSRRLKLKSSQVGAVADAQRSRWSHARRMELVMRLLTSSELDALITGESPFDELPALLARLAASPGYTLTHRIAY